MSTDHASPAAGRKRRLVWVRALTWGLPGLAGLLLLLVAGQLLWGSVAAALHPPAASTDQAVRMIKPTFSGLGKDGSRYQLTALSGVRDAKDDKRILLDHPIITVSHDGQPDTHTTSRRGVYQEDAHTLQLTGDVKGEQPGGYTFASNDAMIDTTTGKVIGGALKGQNASSAVQSNSYAVSDKGDKMVFKGRVRARLNEK